MAKINQFREAVVDCDVDEACELADTIMDVMGKESPKEVFDFLDKASVKSHHAALICAASYLLRPEPAAGHRLKLLRKASKSNDDELAASAYFAIGMESLIEGSHPEKAITAFRKSAGLGNYEGNLQLARAYENGVFGENNRITKAFNLLAEAVDDNYAPAKIALADFSIRNGIHDEDYCPHQLLEEAIDDGIEGAIEMLALYEAMMMHDHGLELLPSEVVPTDMTRPQQIREVLLGSTGATDEQAELLIAAWHGFRSWEDMSIACSGAHKIQGRFDEDCTLDEIVSRKNAQVDILARKIAAPRYVAEAIWELLRPTSRDFKPSLDTLDELLQEKGQGH